MISGSCCNPYDPMLMRPWRKGCAMACWMFFSDNYMQVVMKSREFLLGIAIEVVHTLDILNEDREKALGVLCELLHAVSESIPKQESKENR